MIRHAGLIAAWSSGRWLGALIEGPSGAGKSDLAIRAIQQGFRLVADDRVLLWASGGRLWGRAPDALHGLIEMRGLDVVAEPALRFCEVGLVVRLGAPERIPDAAFEDVMGVRTPVVEANPFEGSAPAKLSRAIAAFDVRCKRRM